MPATIAENPCKAQDAVTDQKTGATAVWLGFVSSTLTPTG
ncbi:hypothetical protein HMPREF1162_0084 [ [[Propionibacterium] namnetense SK182B-JCVI]|uniref:Uncharacterized protein n=1 Tax=[Propionibacterium] namnetense SK182B-JCVI TaxID=1051006 RepID=F9NSR9_9ACTN|nr:hypothetical protein HMPREF1162_0084 [ [[Propionibacterium] namnetense SK182B-JCVI]